ncbi:MAG: nucleotide exchange factor GrpE [Candidatus Lernaella stagnicola]|nr:nucleotide exchange factor GrpE [Candidatus Lernaella stagnicola]
MAEEKGKPKASKTNGADQERAADTVAAEEAPVEAPSDEEAGDPGDWQARYIRLAADMDNFRKRTERELASRHEAGLARAVMEFLPVLDSLDRSLESAPAGQDEAWRTGVEKIHQQFLEALTRIGVQPISAEGGSALDPRIHEVLATQPSTDIEAEKILQTFQVGYTLNERLLRPAKVIVAVAPPDNQSQE